jgi:serine/threonine protein phosphatase PrpC
MNRTKPSNAVRPDGQTSSRWRSDRTRSTALLNHCRELASSTLIEALPAIMDKLDDAMFDLANRSDDNQQRSVYFESMRHVRVKRAGIETEFRRVFKESVQATLERLADSNEASGFSDVSSEDLDLVGEDDLEETLAVTNMVRKIRTNCKQPLYALDRRIAELLKVDEIEPENNPFGPETMCNAFKDACDQIDVDVEVRLVILKLFDQHIGAQLERLYCEINDYLVAEAVLPAIRHNVKAQPNVAQEPGAESSAGPAPDTPAPPPIQHDQPAIAQPVHVASTNAGLLDALRQIMDVNFVTRNAAHPPSEGQLWLVGQLTHLQQGDSQGACEDLASLDVSGVRTGTVNVLRDLKRPTVVNGIGEIDAMMFDVVAMMFDFILDDKKMPAPMKALIGRLQIPMLKVAILDKAFFARKFHPARKFLNAIAEAAVGWSEDQDRNDALYAKLEAMVERVIGEFDERVEVFAEVLAELEKFLEQEETEAESSANVFADAIQGRERLKLARTKAEEQIQRCLGQPGLYDVVGDFLTSHWKELLFVRYFEEGDTGEGWTEAVQAMDDLVWSVAPKSLDQDRRHLTEVLPGLLRRIRDGMKQLGIPGSTSARFLSTLKKLHIAAIRNEPCGDDSDPFTRRSAVGDSDSTSDIVIEDVSSDSIDFHWPEAEPYSVEELSLIKLAIHRANEVIYGTAASRPECIGMGTTLVAAQFRDNRLTAAHVGDARLYRLRGDVFQRLTADHSLRQHLVNKGIYTAEEVEQKLHSNVITRAIGPEVSVDVDVQEIETEPDDLYLLCSDGLTDMVDDVTLSEILSEQHMDLATASRALVDRANESGGCDNISVILARVIGTGADSKEHGGDSNGAAHVDMYGLTDVGRKRSHNEDHIALDTAHGIAIVADGMGGCNAGEIASEMAVKIILEALRNGSVDTIGVTSGEGTRTSRITSEDRLAETTADASALRRRHGGDIVIEGLGTDIAYEPEEEDEFTDIVRSLDVGSWVEFYHVDGGTTRARLTWVSPVTGRYLFTDRKGMKVADCTVHGLAMEMKRSSVAVIEDVPLFDRIIGTIKEHLHADNAQSH